MNKNSKFTKSVKRKLFKKYLDLDGKIHLILSIGNINIEKRISYLITNFKRQELNLQDCNDDLSQHKDLLKWFNNQLTRDQFEKQEILQKVLEEPYSKETSRISKLLDKLDSYKPPYRNAVDNKLQQLSSPSTPLNRAQRIQMNNLSNGHELSTISFSPESNETNSNSSSSTDNNFPSGSSSANSNRNTRNNRRNLAPGQVLVHERHQFNFHKVVSKSKATCGFCKAKYSTFNQKDKKLHECTTCGIYGHFSCIPTFRQPQCCIPLPRKTWRLDATGERTVEARDLNAVPCQHPTVPPMFLYLMHHVQTAGCDTTNLYRAEGLSSNKAVKELADKLLQGKARELGKHSIETACECFKWLLSKLDVPIIPDDILLQYIAGSRRPDDGQDFTEVLYEILNKNCKKSSIDILTYLLVHLKIVAGFRRGKNRNDMKELAEKFAPLLISDAARAEHLAVTIDLLEGLMHIEYAKLGVFVTDCKLFMHVPELAAAFASSLF